MANFLSQIRKNGPTGAVVRASPSYNVAWRLWSQLGQADRRTGGQADRQTEKTTYWVRLTLWLNIMYLWGASYSQILYLWCASHSQVLYLWITSSFSFWILCPLKVFSCHMENGGYVKNDSDSDFCQTYRLIQCTICQYLGLKKNKAALFSGNFMVWENKVVFFSF